MDMHVKESAKTEREMDSVEKAFYIHGAFAVLIILQALNITLGGSAFS